MTVAALLGTFWAGCGAGAPAVPEALAKGPPGPAAAMSVEAPLPTEPPPPRCEPLAVRLPEVDRSVVEGADVALFDPTGEGLAHFYERLARLGRGHAKDHVRIAIYGDSNMTMDFIAGPLRRSLQRAFGDGGHGFIALGRPWSHYLHFDVTQKIDATVRSYAITTHQTGDGAYGIAGIVGESAFPGARVRVGTAPLGAPTGTTASRFDIFYLRGPRRGAFDLEVDGAPRIRIETEGDSAAVGIERVVVPDGPHAFGAVVRSPALVRFLGGAIERTEPGIVVDNLGVGAMNTRCIVLMREEIAAPILAHRRYDLVIVMTGTSDGFQVNQQARLLSEIIRRHRVYDPRTSVLLVAPPDRGDSPPLGRLLEDVATIRRELAEPLQVGFWSLFSAMGGRESMKGFVSKKLALPDQIHFTAAGGQWVSERLERALLGGFQSYLEGHPDAGCVAAPEDEPPPRPEGQGTL